MTNKREHLLEWLRDAHAMESQAESMLKAQSSRIENYPELHDRIDRHITETQSQARRLEECLDSLGEDRSAMKDAAGRMTAMMQGIGGAFAGDEIVKGAMAGYTFEHFEISAYKALIAAAEACGETRIADVGREILREEEAMAEWLSSHLPDVTKTYLSRDEQGLQAKR